MINDDRAQKALIYLAESDERAAALFTEMERAEERAKQIKDAMFLHSDGKNIEERKARASNSEEYQQAMSDYFAATRAYREVANKRSTEELVVRAWQTVSSNRRQGTM